MLANDLSDKGLMSFFFIGSHCRDSWKLWHHGSLQAHYGTQYARKNLSIIFENSLINKILFLLRKWIPSGTVSDVNDRHLSLLLILF